MNKIYKFAALVSAALMTFASCAPEELSTDQLSDENVTFAAMAPNPVARGGALRIQGSNLDRIVEVQIPGVEPITDIIQVDSLKGRLSEIRVIVPVDGPEVGKVVIVDGEGNKYTSLADLTYSEPIIFTGFSPENAMPGDVVTITGDYMNNIRSVQFGTATPVVEFAEQSRYELKVVVPSDAVTGKLIISDVDENNNPDGLIPNLFYSEKELTIGSPTVKAADRGMLKAGDKIKVTGAYLDMIEKAAFKVTTPAAEEGAEATVAYTEVDFTLAEDHKSITVELPASVVEGEVVLTSYAGEQFNAGAYTTVVPTGLAIAAETRYKAGLKAVVTGKDLDLVTGAKLAGTDLDIVYADNKITFAIPSAAVDGTVVLALANGKTVETAAVELVKPTITGMTPLEFYVPDQEKVEISGTDLDLVKSATLGGRDVEINVVSAEKLEILPTITSVGGKVALALDNGVVVESADAINVLYHSLVVVTEIPAAQHIGEEVVIKGSNMDLIENIFIGEEKVTKYSIRTPEEVRFLMPWLKVGMYDVSFHLFNGDVETQANKIEVQLERVFNTIWEGESYVTWDGGAVTNLSWDGYDWSTVKAGTTLVANFTVDEAAQVRFGNGSWVALPTTKTFPTADGDGNISVDKSTTYLSVKLSAADLAELQNNGGLVLCGTGYNITSIVLITEISQEVTLWEGELIADDWANQPYALSDGGAELQQAGAQPGQTIYFYVEPYGDPAWKVQIVEGHWGPTYLSVCSVGGDTEAGKFTEFDLDANGGKFGFTLTQEMLDAAYAAGGWGGVFVLNGDNTKCTKITLL